MCLIPVKARIPAALKKKSCKMTSSRIERNVGLSSEVPYQRSSFRSNPRRSEGNKCLLKKNCRREVDTHPSPNFSFTPTTLQRARLAHDRLMLSHMPMASRFLRARFLVNAEEAWSTALLTLIAIARGRALAAVGAGGLFQRATTEALAPVLGARHACANLVAMVCAVGARNLHSPPFGVCAKRARVYFVGPAPAINPGGAT